MMCNNPLKQLAEFLNYKETNENLIDMCERFDSVREFANEIARRASVGTYDSLTVKTNPLDAYDAAAKFAAWWSYR